MCTVPVLTSLDVYVSGTIISCLSTEAFPQRCWVTKVFLKLSQNSQKNTCVRISFLRP